VPAPFRPRWRGARDDEHAEAQRAIYAARRGALRTRSSRWLGGHSFEAGLTVGCHPGYDCWEAVRVLANAGILVAPGDFYGPEDAHIRCAHRTDERMTRRDPAGGLAGWSDRMFRLYDTLAGSRAVAAGHRRELRMYTCGPTCTGGATSGNFVLLLSDLIGEMPGDTS